MTETPMTLKVFHSYTQPRGENQCRLRLDRCSHVCVPSPRSPRLTGLVRREAGVESHTVCLCPANMKLSSNGASCVQDVEVGSLTEVEELEERGTIFDDKTLFYGLIIGCTAIFSVTITLILFFCARNMVKGSRGKPSSSAHSAPP